MISVPILAICINMPNLVSSFNSALINLRASVCLDRVDICNYGEQVEDIVVCIVSYLKLIETYSISVNPVLLCV